MNPIRARHPLLRRVTVVLSVLYVAGTIIGGIGLGETAVHHGRRPIPVHAENQIECEENAQPRCVFGFGESMGAGQILQALTNETRFCAVVAESPFESFREVSYARFGLPFHAGPWLGRTFFWPTDEVGFLYVRLRYGLDMDSASPQKAVAASKVPVFLIHGTSDRNIPSYNSEDIQAANPSTVILWLVPQAEHCGAHAVTPEEFDRRILAWFSGTHRPPGDSALNS